MLTNKQLNITYVINSRMKKRRRYVYYNLFIFKKANYGKPFPSHQRGKKKDLQTYISFLISQADNIKQQVMESAQKPKESPKGKFFSFLVCV